MRLAHTLASVPGGYDVLLHHAKEQRRPHEALPYSLVVLVIAVVTSG